MTEAEGLKEDYETWERKQKEERRQQAQEQLAEFHAQRQRELEARRQSREVAQTPQVVEDPLQLLSSLTESKAASSGGYAPSKSGLRICEAEELRSFRRVPLPGGVAFTSFVELEAAVAQKFASKRRADGSEVGVRRLVSLIRLQDQLQIGDDDDVAELREGDELEATFAET